MRMFEGTGVKVDVKTAESAVTQTLKSAGMHLLVANEAKTRVEIIDKVLAAFGWRHEDVEREVASGAGGYLDYELRVRGQPWMVVEAKRNGVTFQLPEYVRASSALHSVQSLYAKANTALKEAFNQAASYCNDRGVTLAAVTNGYQWVIFRGRSRQGVPWLKGAALVFHGVDDVANRFDEFFGALSRNYADTTFLLKLLEQHGVRLPTAPKRPRDFIRTTRRVVDANRIAGLRSVADYLLSDIHGQNKGEMLERCYVEPGGAPSDFSRSVDRLLRDSEAPIERLADETLAGDTEKFVEELERREKAVRLEQPVIVVGHVGAGKTTFIHRSLARFREDKTAVAVFVDLEGYGKGGTVDARAEEERVSNLIVEKLGRAASTVLRSRTDLSVGEKLQADPDDPATLRTLLRDELAREQKLGEKVWSLDPAAWPKTELEILRKARSDSYGFLVRYSRHFRARFRRLDHARYPVLIVLDNLDQATDEYQRAIYGVAQRVAKETPAVVVITLREDTYRRGLTPGGFLTSSSLPFVFHVGAPPLDRVMRQRMKFAKTEDFRAILPGPLRVDDTPVNELCGFVESVLLRDKADALSLVACLAGSNVRNGLDLVRSVVVGAPSVGRAPEPSAEFALDSLLAIRGDEYFKAGRFLSNCFDTEPAAPPTHGLKARLLAYFAWAYESVTERAHAEAVDTVLVRFAKWGYTVGGIQTALLALRGEGLLRPFDESERGPSQDDLVLPKRLTITASGDVHLRRLLPLRAYRAAMAMTCRWYSDELVAEFIRRAEAAGGSEGLTIGDIAESSALNAFETYLAQSVTNEDAQLASDIGGESWLVEVRSRAAVVAARTKDAIPNQSAPAVVTPKRDPTTFPAPDQLKFILVPDEEPTSDPMPPLEENSSFEGTVWIPRILWALEWASRNGKGPLSAADTSRVLDAHAGFRVPATNVARAFRDLRGLNQKANYWLSVRKRYEITPSGRMALEMILKQDCAPEF